MNKEILIKYLQKDTLGYDKYNNNVMKWCFSILNYSEFKVFLYFCRYSFKENVKLNTNIRNDLMDFTGLSKDVLSRTLKSLIKKCNFIDFIDENGNIVFNKKKFIKEINKIELKKKNHISSSYTCIPTSIIKNSFNLLTYNEFIVFYVFLHYIIGKKSNNGFEWYINYNDIKYFSNKLHISSLIRQLKEKISIINIEIEKNGKIYNSFNNKIVKIQPLSLLKFFLNKPVKKLTEVKQPIKLTKSLSSEISKSSSSLKIKEIEKNEISEIKKPVKKMIEVKQPIQPIQSIQPKQSLSFNERLKKAKSKLNKMNFMKGV